MNPLPRPISASLADLISRLTLEQKAALPMRIFSILRATTAMLATTASAAEGRATSAQP